jgi:hypothetical protein
LHTSVILALRRPRQEVRSIGPSWATQEEPILKKRKLNVGEIENDIQKHLK